MRGALTVICVLAACGKDVPPGGMQPDAPAGVTDVSGQITANATWSSMIVVTGGTTIDPGVTVTVMPGTQILVAATAAIAVQGTLDIEGTSAAHVTLAPDAGAPHWNGFTLPNGGTFISHYFFETGGTFEVAAATLTIFDSELSHASHDLMVMSDGNLDMEYSAIGVEPPATDTTHCDMHVGGSPTLKVVHTNVSTSVYGIMFYGGAGADFTYDNWFSNQIDVSTLAANPVSGNFSNGWFEKGTAPSGAGITATNMSSTRLTDAGPRP
jgi:hypothetical protein